MNVIFRPHTESIAILSRSLILRAGDFDNGKSTEEKAVQRLKQKTQQAKDPTCKDSTWKDSK
jgi:thiamine pyrophosphokinase